MNKLPLVIEDISPSGSGTGAYVLILTHKESGRKLPVIIGNGEAQAIAVEMEKMVPSRPLTHDLFKSLCVRYEVDVLEVFIHRLSEGVFYSKLITRSADKTVEIDARTSDAVAIAVRFNCPILCSESVLDEAGIISSATEKIDQENDTDSALSVIEQELNNLDATLEELDSLLNEALENEDYEKASLLRDEIQKRKSGN